MNLEDRVVAGRDIPAPSLAEVMAAKYKHILLSEADKHLLADLQHNLYRIAARLSLAANAGDAYGALMTADMNLSCIMEGLAKKIRAAA